MRFLTGIGVGALVATTGAIVAEYAPPGKKNLCNAITYSGVPSGSLLAAFLAILLQDSIGWRGMFWIGALPLVTLLPLAFFKMPESSAWLVSRGRIDRLAPSPSGPACRCPRHRPHARKAATAGSARGSPACSAAGYLVPHLLLGFMSATGLVLVYSLNTWLPELMRQAGFNAKGSLSFLLVLNGGAVIGALVGPGSPTDSGPSRRRRCFLIGAVSIALLTSASRWRCCWRSSRSSGWHQRHPDPDLRLRGQLLPDQHPRRRRGVVRRIRPAGRHRRPADRRLHDRRRPGPQLDFLRAGRTGRAGNGPDPSRAARSRPPRSDDHAGRADTGTDCAATAARPAPRAGVAEAE